MPERVLTLTTPSKRNKLRRRRRPSLPPLMAIAVNGADHFVPNGSISGSDSTLLEDKDKRVHTEKESTMVSASPRSKESSSDDPQSQVIASLRSQISDLISQVTQLNGKLVKSYDRVSDLEDELHVASNNIRANSIKINELELERTQHLAALNTGLLVEKSHVTSELTRLMERATDEAAARGQAETARANIEQDLDDLSANLFDQANRMVAEARLGKAMSERKVIDSEMALKSAEEAVGMMQGQMQLLQEEKGKAEEEMAKMKALMGKGKYVEHPEPSTVSVKLLNSHSGYQEFLLFITHLRSVRPTLVQPPSMPTLLTLPFLSRLQTEDSDPTVRLDSAPSLNWLSRRSVLSAICSGHLNIEPMQSSNLLLESTTSLQSIIPGANNGPSCALCGTSIFPTNTTTPSPSLPFSNLSLSRHASGITNSNTWSSSFFKSNNTSAAPSPPLTPPPHATSHNTNTLLNPPVVYVFRLAQTQTPTHPTQAQAKPTNYPLCNSGWCLARLRTTCSLWAFIRSGVIDRVWEEPLSAPQRIPSASVTSLVPEPIHQQSKVDAPPIPPRRRSKMSSMGASVGSLWGMASGALRTQPQSPVKQNDTEKESEEKIHELPDLPPKAEPVRKAATVGALSVSVPPPLPRRNVERITATRSDGNEEKTPKPDDSSSESPSDTNKSENSEASDETPTALVTSGAPPPPEQITASTSQSSSVQSGIGEEFTTPVEEFSSMPLPSPVGINGNRTSTPPLTIPTSAPRSPPRSPPRRSLSPRSVPLPESRPSSRPGSPIAGSLSRSRPTSGSVAPLQIKSLQSQLEEAEKGSPSRTTSPAPQPPSLPPPLPRRAPARRTVPAPPGAPAVQVSVSTASAIESESPNGTGEEKKDVSEAENKPRMSEEVPFRPLPPPRRYDHGQKLSVSSTKAIIAPDTISVSEYEEDNDEKEKTEAKDSTAEKENSDASYISDATWEERTWKEIVRLREDMFWARVGAIRN